MIIKFNYYYNYDEQFIYSKMYKNVYNAHCTVQFIPTCKHIKLMLKQLKRKSSLN